MSTDKYRFDGRHALVIGGATGMGAAASTLLNDLGASVSVADVAEPTAAADRYLPLDLRDRAAIESLVDGLDGPVDVLLSCAGIAAEGPDLPLINLIGHRHLIERALDRDLLPSGSAIGMIASIGGIAWQKHLDDALAFLDTADFDEAVAWLDKRPELANYVFSKQAMIVYCARRAPQLFRRGIRINCVAPGPTMTPLMEGTESWQGFEHAFHEVMGRPGLTAEDAASPLVFLVSDAAGYVSGTCMPIDGGFITGGIVGAVESPIVDLLLT